MDSAPTYLTAILSLLLFYFLLLFKYIGLHFPPTTVPCPIHAHLLPSFYLLIFRERGTEGDREGEKHQCVVAFHTPPTGDLARNPGMCPDWEWNWRPFGSQAGAQSLSRTATAKYVFLNHTIAACVRLGAWSALPGSTGTEIGALSVLAICEG